MKDINYYKNNFGNLTLEELNFYYWLLIEECAKKLINNENFDNLNTELMVTSNAITMINFLIP